MTTERGYYDTGTKLRKLSQTCGYYIVGSLAKDYLNDQHERTKIYNFPNFVDSWFRTRACTDSNIVSMKATLERELRQTQKQLPKSQKELPTVMQQGVPEIASIVIFFGRSDIDKFSTVATHLQIIYRRGDPEPISVVDKPVDKDIRAFGVSDVFGELWNRNQELMKQLKGPGITTAYSELRQFGATDLDPEVAVRLIRVIIELTNRYDHLVKDKDSRGMVSKASDCFMVNARGLRIMTQPSTGKTNTRFPK